MLRVHVVPHFGGWQNSAVDTPAVRAFLAKMSDAGSAVGTQRAARKVLRLVLGTAIEGNAIKHNPCDGVRLARSQREEMVCLTLDEVHALADAMRRPEYGLLVRFVTLTGLRAGEVGALRIGRLDLLRGRVDVVEAVSEVTGHGLVYGPIKTYERRSVPIPRAMCDELGAYLASRPADPDAFVFTAPDGGPLRHHNFYARHFRPAVVAAGLPERMRFHDYAPQLRRPADQRGAAGAPAGGDEAPRALVYHRDLRHLRASVPGPRRSAHRLPRPLLPPEPGQGRRARSAWFSRG